MSSSSNISLPTIARAVKAVAEAVAKKQPYSIEHRVVRPDGTERIVQEHADLTFDEQGRLRRIVGAVQDITETVQARERTGPPSGRGPSWPDVNAEIAHRTKNNLAMAASVLQLQAAEEPEERTAAALERGSRPSAYLCRHSRTTADTQEGEIDFLAAVQRIVEAIQKVYGRRGVTFSLDAEPLLLPSRQATNLAIATNELITNRPSTDVPEMGRAGCGWRSGWSRTRCGSPCGTPARRCRAILR